jgi:hypothetical protein
VEEVLSTVTFSPVGVTSVKPDLEMLSIVPDDPPAAGPERAFELPAPGMRCADIDARDGVVVALVEPVLAVALTIP